MKLDALTFVLVTTAFCAVGVESANILLVIYFGSRSHKILFDTLARGLADHGHQVTLVSPFLMSADFKNVKDVNPKLVVEGFPKVAARFQKRETRNEVAVALDIFDATIEMCELFLASPEIQKLMKSKFDLVLIDALQNDCAIGLAYRLNAPFGYIATASLNDWQAMGTKNPIPTSIIPHAFLPFTSDMTFWERSINFLFSCTTNILRLYYAFPKEDAIMRRYLGDDLPSLEAMERNTSLILINQHFSLEYPRAWLPGHIEIGGVHCKSPKALPDSLLEFVEGSQGFIYFSFGSFIRGSQMDPKLRDTFLNVFGKLKERVLWKWETETMEGVEVPKNVKLSKWLPQQDILGHPKCRLFITHGGVLSTQEAIFHAVPVLVMPFFGDQETNGNRAELHGYGLKMEVTQVTTDTFQYALHRLLNEPHFHLGVEEISRRYRDQPQAPLERAIFWTEYVIRHKGAVHMHSIARDMPWYQIYLVDVIAFLVTIITIVIVLVYLTLRMVLHVVCGKRNKQKQD